MFHYKRKWWSQEENAVLFKMLSEGKTRREIAASLGRSRGAVTSHERSRAAMAIRSATGCGISDNRRKISIEMERELALHYIDAGPVENGKRCKALGLSPQYGMHAAAAIGLRRPRYRKGTRYKDQDKPVCTYVKPNDPRWERARKIGTVVV